MEKRISKTDERNMTTAIEKAASAAVLDPSKDRNKLLADSLLENGVDSRFAKRASQAFNKRLTVMTFDRTPEEKRGDSFALSDPDTVFSMTGGVENGQMKTASAAPKTPYGISMAEQPMGKTASTSEKPVKRRPLWEERISADGCITFLGGLLTKHAACFKHDCAVLETEKLKLERRRKRLVDDLKKVASFYLDNLYSLFGDKFEHLFGKDVGRKMTKQASVVRPDDRITNEVASIINGFDQCDKLNDCLCDYKDGLCELNKSASDLAQDFVKIAAPSIGTAAGIGIRTVPTLVMPTIQALDAIRRATNDSLAAGFSNASALAAAGNDSGVAPGKVLDAEFLVKDRFRDRLMGWSDMAADPLFSMFPAEQVFSATQRAMDVDPSLERPDKRELLRSHVGKLLAQNNREGEADLSALGTTLRQFAGADMGAAEAASAPVLALDKKEPPERPELINIFDLLNKQPLSMATRDYAAEAAKANAKALEEDKTSKSSDKDDKHAFSDFIHNTGVRIRPLPNGTVQYLVGRTPLTMDQLRSAFNAYKAANNI